MSCEDAGSPGFLDAGFVASPAHCSSLLLSLRLPGKIVVCMEERRDSGRYLFGLHVVDKKFCSELRVDCSLITSCNDYGNIGLKAGALTAGGGVKLYAGGSEYNPDENSAEIKAAVKTLCEQDPCVVAPVPTVRTFDPSLSSYGGNEIYKWACL